MRAVFGAFTFGLLTYGPPQQEKQSSPPDQALSYDPGSTTSLRIHSSGADPWVLSHNDCLYYTHTTGRNITLWTAADLPSLSKAAGKVVWTPGKSDRALSKNIWAPELHHLRGKWYIYFAADDGNNHNHRMYVLEGREPGGPYQLKAKLSPKDQNNWAIDGTVLELNGALYFIWSGWPGDVNGRQNLYIAELENPWTISSKRFLISQPQFSWESWINEGPQILKNQGRTFLVYSANRSWTDHYRLGMLELTGSNPLELQSWHKFPRPVFQGVVSGSEPIYAPGHCSFLVDSKLSHSWLLYHVARYRGAGWRREVRAQRLHWSQTGAPEFGFPRPLQRKRRLLSFLPGAFRNRQPAL